jgi:hypothetical protein
MGVDLRSTSGEEFQFSNSGWRYLIAFAEAHGFSWPLESNGEEREALDADQAAALANAVDRGIGSESSEQAARRASAELTKLLVTPSPSTLFSDEPLNFPPETIEQWKRFIGFALAGGFSMEF